MSFLIPAAIVTALILLALGRTLLRRRATGTESTAAHDMIVYRSQMAELDKDLARGTLTPEEAEQGRRRLARQMLTADREMDSGTGAGQTASAAPRRVTLIAAGAVVLLFAGAAFAYLRLGAPGYRDQSLAARYATAEKLYETRPSQEEAEKTATATLPAPQKGDPKFLDLMRRLREAVAANPTDPTGLSLLARNEFMLGNYVASREAQQKLIALKGDTATAEDYAQLGETEVVATGGLVTQEAEEAFNRALAKAPGDGRSLYYLGLMMAQNGRPDRALKLWNEVLRDAAKAPMDARTEQQQAPWLIPIRQNIAALATAAGYPNYRIPEGTAAPASAQPGPSAEDVAAAGKMSAGDRAEMIRGMVGRLEERLEKEGGTAQDWARLVSSLRLIGETDKAGQIATEAKTKLNDDPAATAEIDAALKTPAGGALVAPEAGQNGQAAPAAEETK